MALSWRSCFCKKATRFSASSGNLHHSIPIRIDHLYQDPHEPGIKLKLIYGDLNDGRLHPTEYCALVEPDEIYNLGGSSPTSR